MYKVLEVLDVLHIHGNRMGMMIRMLLVLSCWCLSPIQIITNSNEMQSWQTPLWSSNSYEISSPCSRKFPQSYFSNYLCLWHTVRRNFDDHPFFHFLGKILDSHDLWISGSNNAVGTVLVVKTSSAGRPSRPAISLLGNSLIGKIILFPFHSSSYPDITMTYPIIYEQWNSTWCFTIENCSASWFSRSCDVLLGCDDEFIRAREKGTFGDLQSPINILSVLLKICVTCVARKF